ncbi:hypothetical protein C0995_007054 [Termitomyces sp. Mi166|nr:hypothetical protein C0995_007054 [Termitomyces sp. Mi166\
MLLADFLLSLQMVPKIFLVKISADASLLECKHTTQEFIIAADAVFFKAQGLVMLVPLHKMVFGLLEGLLDNWHLLNLDLVEWRCKAEVHQACVNLWSLNKQVPWCAEFGKTVSCCFKKRRKSMLHNSSTLPPTQEQPSQQAAPCNKGKGKAKAMEEDEDEEGEAAQKLRKELEDFVVLTKAAKAFLKRQDKSSQFFILEGFKEKGKTKALGVDSELTGAKQTFKSTELVDSNSNEKEEEEEVHLIKKIKHEHLTEESSVLIINQATEVAATQETLQVEDTSDEDENDEDGNDNKGSKGDDDNSNDENNAAMDIDSSRHLEET